MSKILQIYQFSDAYCYNSDTLFLWDFIKDYLKNGDDILDICSGSGILGLLCARDNNINLTQIEIQKEFSSINLKNALANKIKSTIVNEDFRNFQADKKFNLIVSNPPFYPPSHVKKESSSKNISTNSSLLPLKDLIQGVKKLLKPQGRFIFCYHTAKLDSIICYLNESKLNINSLCFVHSKISSPSKLVLVHARLNSKANMSILPPIITHIGPNQQDNSPQVLDIYKRANTHSIKVKIKDLI